MDISGAQKRERERRSSDVADDASFVRVTIAALPQRGGLRARCALILVRIVRRADTALSELVTISTRRIGDIGRRLKPSSTLSVSNLLSLVGTGSRRPVSGRRARFREIVPITSNRCVRWFSIKRSYATCEIRSTNRNVERRGKNYLNV